MIFLNTHRSSYGFDDMETMTLGEMIYILEELVREHGEEETICFKNDNGYTYGYISEYDFETEEQEED